jgi:hypothetical protein
MSFLKDFYLTKLPTDEIVGAGLYFIKGYWDKNYKIFVRNSKNTRWKKIGETPDISAIQGRAGLYKVEIDEEVTITTESGILTEAELDIVYQEVDKGAINCTSNPNYPAAEMGDFYTVSHAGKIGGASGDTVAVGDKVLCIEDNGGGTKAQVGTKFEIIPAEEEE